jgi:acetyl esterase/lipase
MAPAGPVHDFPEGRLDAARTAADDARTAIRWLRAHARELGVDPRRIAVGGASAGAVTALLVATERPRLVRAAVSISGALPDERPFRRGDPPVLFFHGTADPLVPYDWALANATALRGERVPVVLDTLWQAGHVPWSRYRRRIVTESERFLDDVLDVTHPDRAPRRVPSWGLPPAEWMRLSPR